MEDPLCWARALLRLVADGVSGKLCHISFQWLERTICSMVHNGLGKDNSDDRGREGCGRMLAPLFPAQTATLHFREMVPLTPVPMVPQGCQAVARRWLYYNGCWYHLVQSRVWAWSLEMKKEGGACVTFLVLRCCCFS